MRLGPRPRRPRVKAVLRRGWATATYGARRPGRRMAGLALCGVVSGLGESLVVVLVVGLVSRDVGSRLPLIGVVAIAHRLSTVRTCERLVVMDAGRVSVVGAPERVARGDETWLREALAIAGPASESPRG